MDEHLVDDTICHALNIFKNTLTIEEAEEFAEWVRSQPTIIEQYKGVPLVAQWGFQRAENTTKKCSSLYDAQMRINFPVSEGRKV